MGPLISLLIVLVVLAIVFAIIVRAVLPLLGLGQPFDTIIYLVMLLIALFVVLNYVGVGVGGPVFWHR